MTDDINNSNVVDDNANDVIQSIESSLDQNEGPAVDDVPTSEKMLTQTEVNSIVGSAKQKGFNKGYQEALTELSKMNFQPEIPQPVNNVPKKAEKATGSKSNLTPDEVQKMISESM
ncbi:MAG: hypothetical protein GWN62_34830, partial [Aliifodinibius sp.]|nr:hypothetical protein [Fodinibius sp.]